MDELNPPAVPDARAAQAIEPPPLPAPPPSEPRPEPVIFHGDAKEFFRIWIVNTLLTLLTLGVFIAWAKVRKRRYLRGSTELLGHRFDYRAEPSRILVGNIIVFVFFLGYAVFGVVYPIVRYGVIVAGVLMLPWIVVRSLSFNAHNTVYRGLRFRFNTSFSAPIGVYFLEPILILFTLGLYYPAWIRSQRRYIVNSHKLGDAYFHFDGQRGPFYVAYLLAALVVGGTAMIWGLGTGIYAATHATAVPPQWMVSVFLAVYLLGLYVGRCLVYARVFNHVWNNTRLDQHRFAATMNSGKWLGLQLTNLGAIIVSLGMLYPWSVIRAQRYVASCLTLTLAGPVETIEALGSSSGSGVGDSAAEFIGLDFGL